MRSAVAPGAPETLSILDAMLALGLEDNSFHQWALREKARVQSKKDDEKGQKDEEKEKKGDAK